jgi:hypothetical protein
LEAAEATGGDNEASKPPPIIYMHQPSEDSCHDQSCNQFIPNAASEQSTCGPARQKKNDDDRNLDYNEQCSLLCFLVI